MNETLVMVRHAETAWNKEQRLQDSRDLPLSPEGILQAESLAQQLHSPGISHVLSSELQRAVQTAQIIANKLHVPLETNPGLNERSYGALEGRLWPEIKEEIKTKKISLDEFAEPIDMFRNRVLKALGKTLLKYSGETTLIVCHGGGLRILLDHLGLPSSDHTNIGYELPNASFFVFENRENTWINRTPTTP
ncbi:MAG: histidine phosphatase family protein [bacterium]|nr:histidine phosphatase family protein [bacterium]